MTQPPQPVRPQSPHGQTVSVSTATVRLSVTGTHIVIAWFLTAATFGYLLPWAIAATRHKSNASAIGVLTALTGWTGVGRFVAGSRSGRPAGRTRRHTPLHRSCAV